jgi:hypothetical protein
MICGSATSAEPITTIGATSVPSVAPAKQPSRTRAFPGASHTVVVLALLTQTRGTARTVGHQTRGCSMNSAVHVVLRSRSRDVVLHAYWYRLPLYHYCTPPPPFMYIPRLLYYCIPIFPPYNGPFYLSGIVIRLRYPFFFALSGWRGHL